MTVHIQPYRQTEAQSYKLIDKLRLTPALTVLRVTGQKV